MRYFWVWPFLLLTVGTFSAEARLGIPQDLSLQDRESILEILGEGTAPKILGNPFTMGGYSGFEIGFDTEVLQTGDISRLGARNVNTQEDTSYQVISLGKGIYNDIDIFLQFALLGNSENLSNWGGQVRWTFYQAEYLPVFATLVGGANSANFQNLISTNTQDLDLVLGVTIDDVTLFVGGGYIRSQGSFMGGPANLSITDSGNVENNTVSGSHYVSGVNIRFSEFFVSGEVDRYTESTYSAKVGLRF